MIGPRLSAIVAGLAPACLAAAVVCSCSKSVGPFDPALGDAASLANATPLGPAGPPVALPPAWTISGTIRIAPDLQDKIGPTDVVFVTARVPGQRMPIAVSRIGNLAFPMAFTLDPSHAGEGGGGPPEGLDVSARVSKGGMAGPAKPGDLEGRHAGPVKPGASGVEITIDTVL